MSAPTFPLNEKSHRLLRELAEKTESTPSEVLERALVAYRRQVFFQQLNAGYAAMQNDPEDWNEELKERKPWDSTLEDGLDSKEHWTEDGQCVSPESE